MGSFRELLQKLEDAHDQELSQLREVSCLLFFVVFVFVFCCCFVDICDLVVRFFSFWEGFLLGPVTLRFFSPEFQLPSVAFVQKPPEELRHTRWASRKQTLTINPADLFDDSMKEVPGKDS